VRGYKDKKVGYISYHFHKGLSLKEFAQLAAERNLRKKKQSVTIRIAPDVLECYKTMGNGYTGIMTDVLKYAVDNPTVLSKPQDS
jgi:uncharacterized protein (DUF4415 family)